MRSNIHASRLESPRLTLDQERLRRLEATTGMPTAMLFIGEVPGWSHTPKQSNKDDQDLVVERSVDSTEHLGYESHESRNEARRLAKDLMGLTHADNFEEAYECTFPWLNQFDSILTWRQRPLKYYQR